MKVKVRINPDGITAKEINPLVKPKEWKVSPTKYDFIERKQWQEAESKLRTFEIDLCLSQCSKMIKEIGRIITYEHLHYTYLENSIHEAEIIEGTNKIRIV